MKNTKVEAFQYLIFILYFSLHTFSYFTARTILKMKLSWRHEQIHENSMLLIADFDQ